MSPAVYAHAAALSGLVIWYGVFALLGAQSKWRWCLPLLPVLAGVVSFRVLGWYLGAVHPLVAPTLEAMGEERTLMRYILDVGVREEFLKLLLALPCLLWMRWRSPALLTGALVGLGFATAENRWFFRGHAEPTLLVGRVFSTTLLHAAGTGLCAAALILAWRGHARAWAFFAACFLGVVIAHGVYDWAPGSGQEWLLMGGTSWLSQLMVIALAGWFFAVYRQDLPSGTRGRAALTWFCVSATLQFALALVFTWERWRSVAALEVCGRECLGFIPVVMLSATMIRSSTLHDNSARQLP